ncbi:ThuA domain-containing protein [Halomicrobium urmianum]|uniref:ThuA domain-containing protein n=1 Tax=Halomicrobium urmianum TaxID=1586233 RepID=UPI001CDA096E|nr:ThuA domain-containing protein [Halomicrobium urmianum]
MTDDSSTNDAEDVSTLTTDRRRFVQAAGLAGAGLTGLGGFASAQQGGDNHIELEAVTVETSGGRGRSEYAWEDGQEGIVKGPPEAVCDFVGGNHVWVGVTPDSIADVTNPTLTLTAGETYTVEWTNTDGEEHNFVIADADGTELVASDTIAEEGATQTVEFTATEEMATYYCGPHSGSQRGDVQVGDGAPPGGVEVSNLDPSSATVTAGDTFSVSATVTNTGDSSVTQEVHFYLDDEHLGTAEVTLDAGAQKTVTFENVDTSDLSTGDYTYFVESGESKVTGTLTVQAAGPAELDLMILSATPGFRHGNIEYGIQRMQEESDRIASRVGADTVNYDVIDNNGPADAFPTDASELEKYDAIIWFNTVGDVLADPDQRAAFEEYIQNGGGYVGIHAASDTHHPGDGEWDFYMDMLGDAYFVDHPSPQEAEIHVTDQSHPSTEHLPAQWNVTDEWYDFGANPRGDVHVLATLDETSYDATGSMNYEGFGRDHPIAWCQHYQGGRAWYTGRGHTEGAFDEEAFLDHVAGGIAWAGGFEDDPSNGTIWDSYDREVLADGLNEPMKMDIDADGRVFFTERTTGNLKILDSDTGETTTALTLDVYTGQEDGMQGVALDPDFEENGWLYLYYSPAGDESVNRLSRFTVEGDSIDPATETQILDVDTQRETCCHTGGDLEFDTQGNLYLTTGDDTNPFESSGYTPIDERDGREPFDAQRTSGNTNDLRGSVLRITPQDDGSYTVPDDNLFVDDQYDDSLVRDEIYGMGFRNPFTAAVDPATDEAWVADYGPDSGGWSADRGPMGTTEYAKVDEAGFYGWPYFTGHSVPYKHYDFETGESGRIFDPENPINDSVNNTGLEELPVAEGTSIMSPYDWGGYIDGVPSEWEEYVPYSSMDEVPFPQVTGGAPMVGTVYRHDPEFGDGSLTAAMDGKVFIMEYGSGWIKYVSLDDDGEVMEVDPFLPDENWGSPFDMNVGPDGALYFIDYGGSISKITGGGSSTTASVSVSVESNELVPEESTTATVEIENISDSELSNLEFSLTAGDDVLQVTAPSTTTFDSLAPGSTQSVEFDVAASADATQGTYALDAEVTFTHEGEETSATASGAVSVPKTIVEAPYGANLGGSPPEDSSATSPVVVDGLEFVAPDSIPGLQPVTVYDENASEAPDWYSGPSIGSPTTDEIANTEHDALYQTELFGYNLGLEVPIPNGTYDVTFHEAEIYHGGNGNGGGEGTRVFDISVQGQTVVEDLDVYAEVGHDAAWTTTVEGVEVTDGTLNISTTTKSDMSKFSAVEIRYSEPLRNGLEAYYSLDEETPVNQVTGNEASVVGEPTSGVPGFRNDAWEFDTNGDIGSVASTVVSEPLPLNGEEVTVGAWVNHEAITEDYSRVYHVDEGGDPNNPSNGWNIEFGGTSNEITQQYWDGGSIGANTQPGLPCPEGEWVFVVTVVDGDEATIYVYDEEGQLDGSPGTGDGNRAQSELASLIFMAGDGRETPGLMDEVWAYSRALSDGEVDRLWNQSFQGLDGDGNGDNGDDGDTLQQGLEAHVPLDGDSPTNEVTGNDVSVVGDVETGQSGVTGDAVEVHANQNTDGELTAEADAGDHLVTEPLPLNGDGATVGAWMNYTAFEQWARAPFQVGGSAEGTLSAGWDIEFDSTSQAIVPQVWDGGSPTRGDGGSSIAVDPETWYFVVGVVDGDDARLHVFDESGELDASPQSWPGTRAQSDAENLILGVGDGRDVAGRIDDVWAYSRALSESEVAQLHSQSL